MIYLSRLIEYNSWANRGLLAFVGELPPETLDATTTGVYGTIRDTFEHLLTAEMSYWHRLAGLPRYDESSRPARPEMADLQRLAEESATGLARLVDALPDPATMLPTSSGQRAAATILTQLIMHGVEHRAHVGTILGSNGIEPPDLDSWAHGIRVHGDDWPPDWGPEPTQVGTSQQPGGRSKARRWGLRGTRPLYPEGTRGHPRVNRFARRVALRLLPYRLLVALRRLPRALWLLGRRYECNCCGWRFRHLLPFRNRGNRQCPWCGSVDRHRLLALYLQERTSALVRPTDVLHVAPEEGIRRILQRSGKARTVSVDLEHPLADMHMDIRALTFADEVFDLAICSHVLEHVPEDHKAISELYRVLRPGGTLLVMVPIDESAAVTREDPQVVDPAERLRLYGQRNHVRMYGRDLVMRLGVPGFEVETDRFGASLPADVARWHVIAPTPIFRCSKPGLGSKVLATP